MIFHCFKAELSKMSIIRFGFSFHYKNWFTCCLFTLIFTPLLKFKSFSLLFYSSFSLFISTLLLLQLGELVKRIEQELAEAKSAVKEKEIIYENCVKTVSSLEKSIKEHDNNRESRLKDLEKKIKSFKTQVQSSLKDLKVCLIGSCLLFATSLS